jgi:hypothetical protein
MLLRGPDEAVRLWWQLTARTSTAGGVDPFLIKAAVPVSACVSCGHGEHHEVPSKRGGWIDRCKRCGATWWLRMEYIVRGTVDASWRPLQHEHALVDLADLELAIESLDDVDQKLYGAYLTTNHSQEQVAKLANTWGEQQFDRWERPPGGFTRGLVRAAIKRARRELTEALVARAMMARRVPVWLRGRDREELVEALEPLPFRPLVPSNPAAWAVPLHELDSAMCRNRMRGVAPENMIRLELDRASATGSIYRQVAL